MRELLFRFGLTSGSVLPHLPRIKLAASLVVIAVAIVGLSDAPSPTAFIQTQYFFTYETEFLRRALIGHLVSSFDIQVSTALPVLSYAVVGGLTTAMVAAAAMSPWPDLRSGFAISVFFLASSATLQHLVADLGRFDALWFALLALNLLVIFRAPAWQAALATVGLQVLAMLIHEASFFAILPTALAVLLLRTERITYVGLATLACLAALAVIMTLGSSNGLDLAARMALYEERHGMASPDATRVLYRDLADNVTLTMERGFNIARAYQHLLFAIVMWPAAIFTLMMGLQTWTRSGWRGALVVLSVLAPVALYPIGHDHFRWWSLVMMNIVATGLVLAYHDPSIYLRMLRRSPWLPGMLWIGTCLSLAAGPSAVTRAFY